jgi:hypothetical protein
LQTTASPIRPDAGAPFCCICSGFAAKRARLRFGKRGVVAIHSLLSRFRRLEPEKSSHPIVLLGFFIDVIAVKTAK